jgi:Fe-S cluster assembly protein SufD
MLEQLQRFSNDALAWERFAKVGFPTRKSEPYRHVPLTRLDREWEAPAETSAEPVDGILFSGGRFVPELSRVSERVVLLPLSEAANRYGPILRGRLVARERDPLALLNGALYQEGAFLYIPPGEKCQLQIVHRLSGGFARPRLHLFVGAGASAEIEVTMVGEGDFWSNGVHDCTLEAGAQLRWRQVMGGGCITDHLRVSCKRDSRFEGQLYTEGGELIRSDMLLRLEGEGAEGELKGGWRLAEKRQTHVAVRVEHLAPHCRSRQHFKGVVADNGVSSFEGTIYVAPEAQKTDAFQLNNNLLLGPRAVAHAKPKIEVFADDVKASHGATVGKLDEESLFYLRSRGVSDELACQLLVEGFLAEVT